MCNTKSKRNGWEGSNNVCGSNNSSPRHSSSLFLSLVHSALSRARAHQSKENKHKIDFKKEINEYMTNKISYPSQFVLKSVQVCTFLKQYTLQLLWCLVPFSAWRKVNGLCDVLDGRTNEFKTTIHIGAAANSQQFSLGVHGSPWVSAVGILIMPPQGRLSKLSLNDICINLIHPHIYVSTPQYPYFHPYLHQHHPSTSKSRTFASTSPTFEIMRSQGGRIALSLNDMWINFIHPHIFFVCIHIVNASFIFVIMRPQGTLFRSRN